MLPSSLPRLARRATRAAATALLVVAVPVPSPAAAAPEVLWTADRWPGAWDVTACVPAAWSITSPLTLLPTGRFEVHQGDQGALGGGDRCELIKQTRPVTGMDPAPGRAPMPGGEVRIFNFEALYDSSLQRPTRAQYQTLGQWHHSTSVRGCPGSSPLNLAASGPSGAKRLEVLAQQCVRGVPSARVKLLSTPLVTGRWHAWQFEIKWSPDPAVGYVRFSRNGTVVVPAGCASDGRCQMATQYSGLDGTVSRNHFKLGNYRDKSIAFPTVVSYRSAWIGIPG
jgi:hypothetical protein